MAKSAKGRSSATGSSRRRADLRRTLPREAIDVKAILYRADLLKAVGLLVVFSALAATLTIWSREQVMVQEGQVATDTRLKRVDYQVVDERATDLRREEARRDAPRVYRLNASYLERLEASLIGLPQAVEGKQSLDEISRELVEEFALTEEGLRALQAFVEDGEPTGQWRRWAARLTEDQLRRRPLIDSQEFQIFITRPNRALLLPDGELRKPLRGDPIELRADARAELTPRLRDLVVGAGFSSAVVPHIKARILADPQPTILYDPEETEQRAAAAAEAVEPVLVEHRRGEVLYRRGDVLTAGQIEAVSLEEAHYREAAGLTEIWLPRAGVIGLLLVLIAFLAANVMLAYPRITRNAVRIAAIAALMAGMLALTTVVAARDPNLLLAAAIAPTLLVAVVLMLAYDLRLALLLGAAQGIVVTLALGHGIGLFILLLVGCGTMVYQLRDVRHRNSLVRAAAVTALVLGIGAILLGALEMPLLMEEIRRVAIAEVMRGTLWAVVSSFAVGFLVLGMLPTIERTFGITTGMTLAELRDPKQPLLRQLQQKAPGTYNHSLQVANVAEAAADSIGADSLLVYVGALYHDIGKMNKPEYFVENQAGGANKHDKLSPAMSLLVIVGHVKDGVELAREYGLPRNIVHFIESHHGTTLVEYFYHAARTKAKPADRPDVAEVEFRYPGPKPRTKEAAILMLSDAVESATRAMAEPNPSRIENLVREISRKRLVDGQFDQCDLTFRELGLIEDAIISRLCAIHHGRISYPSSKAGESAADASRSPASPARPISA